MRESVSGGSTLYLTLFTLLQPVDSFVSVPNLMSQFTGQFTI